MQSLFSVTQLLREWRDNPNVSFIGVYLPQSDFRYKFNAATVLHVTVLFKELPSLHHESSSLHFRSSIILYSCPLLPVRVCVLFFSLPFFFRLIFRGLQLQDSFVFCFGTTIPRDLIPCSILFTFVCIFIMYKLAVKNLACLSNIQLKLRINIYLYNVSSLFILKS